MLVTVDYELSIGVEFQMPPPSYNKETCEAGHPASKQLAYVLSPDKHGNVSRGGVSKSSTVPRDWDACAWCLVWGKGKRIQSLWCWEEPQQMETCLLECVSANMSKPATGNVNSVPLRCEAIKDFPLMGWLVALDYMNFLARGLDLRAA